MSASAELQAAIRAALLADAGVTAAVGQRIYDGMPAAGQYPCITFGPSDVVTDDAECIAGEDHTVQLDVWTTGDQGKIWPCKAICDAVKGALHEAAIVLPDPHALHEIRVSAVRVARDPDGITVHGVVTVEAQVQTA